MQEIVAQMLNYFWDEFIIIMIWHCGRGELSTNLYFIYPRIYSNYWSAWRQTGLLSAIFFIHEFSRIRRIGTNYSCWFRCEFNRIKGAAWRQTGFFHEFVIFFYPRICANQANWHELVERNYIIKISRDF